MSQTYVPAFTLEPEKRAAAPKPADGPRTPNFINDVAAGKVELPTIPRVVQQVIAALRDPDVDARKLGEALAQDPVLSAKVLRLANSSFFGGQRSMASIDAAVALIGTQALDRLIVACGVSVVVQGRSRGSTCRPSGATRWSPRPPPTSSRRASAPKREEAYVCGLLHGTGHLILCQDLPRHRRLRVHRLRGGSAAPSWRAIESENFGIDHAKVGALWVETIGFPQAVADTIRNVAEPLPADRRTARPVAAQRLRAGGGGRAQGRGRARLGGAAAGGAGALGGAGGQPDAAFEKLYEALQETEPKM